MKTIPIQSPNGRDSRLVLIVTQGKKTEPVINELFARLEKAGLEYATWHSDTIPNSYRRAVEQSAGDILPQVRALVTGVGIPVTELTGAIPNLKLAISTDPEFRDAAHVNGGGTDLRYVDTQPARLVSYGHIAEEILSYLMDRNSGATPKPEH